MYDDTNWLDEVPCYNDRCAGSPHLIRTQWDTLREIIPAVEGPPFPVAIRIEVPMPGRLLHTWSFSDPSVDLQVRLVGDVALFD